MTALQSCGNLSWKELLPPEQVKEWWRTRRKPQDLWREAQSRPGVYRFVFSERADGNFKHTPCYIGEAGDIGERLSEHFSACESEERRGKDGELLLESGYQVKGEITNSAGDFLLQVLTLEGSLNLFGVVLNKTSFDDIFSRKLLENWAILHAERSEKLYLLNRGMSQGTKDFWRRAKAARQNEEAHEATLEREQVDATQE
jgi:hypothetical protein